MIRRYGQSPRKGQRYTRRPGVYAILAGEEGVLATLQHGDAPEIQLPGGGIDRGEHPITALHREVMEETGWRIEVVRKLGSFRRFAYMPDYDLWAEKLCSIYLARPVRRLGPPTEAGHEALWLPYEHAADLLGNVGDQAFMRDWLAGRL